MGPEIKTKNPVKLNKINELRKMKVRNCGYVKFFSENQDTVKSESELSDQIKCNGYQNHEQYRHKGQNKVEVLNSVSKYSNYDNNKFWILDSGASVHKS